MDIQKHCRTCLTRADEADKMELVSIYSRLQDYQLESMEIVELLSKTVTQLPIIGRNDNLSKMICQSCINTLRQCHTFLEMCLRSDASMRDLTRKIDTEVEMQETDLLVEDADIKIKDPLIDAGDGIKETSQIKKQNNKENLQKVETVSNKANNKTINSQHSDIKGNSHDADYRPRNLKPLAKKSKKSKRPCKNRRDTDTNENDNNCNKTKKPTLICPICKKAYNRFTCLKKHMLQLHKTLEGLEKEPEHPVKMHYCDICHKGFKYPASVKNHKVLHSNELSFLCSICGKGFKVYGQLQEHLLRHSDTKTYQCPDCPKRFACVGGLSRHKKAHSKDRPYACDICGYEFVRAESLKTHKLHHAGLKPFKCEYCGKCFILKSYLQRHVRTHTGEKPHKCRYCDSSFIQSIQLKKHLRHHLGENVYKCELCPKRFPTARILRDHFTEHKDDDEETREKNRLALLEAEDYIKLCLSNPNV